MSVRFARREVKGLRIRGQRGHPEVRAALIRFAGWLRRHREFPTLLPVYLIAGDQVRTGEGELCSASFFAPDSKLDAPYARIATGDFPRLRRSRGRDSALAAYLHSLAHELVHYDQWLAGTAPTERGVDRKATRTVENYAMHVRHP
jgi:hypothetical protein